MYCLDNNVSNENVWSKNNWIRITYVKHKQIKVKKKYKHYLFISKLNLYSEEIKYTSLVLNMRIECKSYLVEHLISDRIERSLVKLYQINSYGHRNKSRWLRNLSVIQKVQPGCVWSIINYRYWTYDRLRKDSSA